MTNPVLWFFTQSPKMDLVQSGNLQQAWWYIRYKTLFPYKPDPMPSFLKHSLRSRVQNLSFLWGPQKFLGASEAGKKQARKGFRPLSAMYGIGYFQNLGNFSNCELQKKIAHAHVRAHSHVCDVRAKQGLKSACDVRACEGFRGLARCDRKFATLIFK
jgi:hypothetical protein